MRGANGSRECAPDDKLRDTRSPSIRPTGICKRSVSQTLNPSSGLGRQAESIVKEVGLMEFWFQPDLFARDHVRALDRYRSGFVA